MATSVEGPDSAVTPGTGSSRLPEVHDAVPHPMARFFPGLRKQRQSRYATSAPRKPNRRAVQTIVHNEAIFLPIWLRYYSRFFEPDDIYVLDNDTSDGSTELGGFHRIPVAHDSVDHRWMADTLADHQARLLDRYDVVVTTDVDEIVAPLPEWGTLDAYLDRLDEEFVNPFGYELLHMRDREPPYRPDMPVLEQRGHWFANDGYDKPVVAMQPHGWAPGLHTRDDGRLNFDPDLRLIHLHRMDYEICRERHGLRKRRGWGQADLAEGWAVHNRIVEEAEFERWFYGDSCFGHAGIEIVVERIPAAWRGLF